jgi:hypothetical protein
MAVKGNCPKLYVNDIYYHEEIITHARVLGLWGLEKVLMSKRRHHIVNCVSYEGEGIGVLLCAPIVAGVCEGEREEPRM